MFMEKIKKIVDNKEFLTALLVIFVLVGILFRIDHLYKPGGLWTDEIISYSIAKQSFPLGIMNHLYAFDSEPPLWFFFLNIWMKIFGNSDLSLRYSSVLTAVLSIPAAYFAGKELSSRYTGVLAAIFTAINSLLIYYSQEVRFYSMFSLFSALSILFLLKIKNNPNKKNYALSILSNLLVLYTATLGIIFVFSEVLIFFAYLLYKHKKQLKPFIYSQLITLILFLPQLIFILSRLGEFDNRFLPPFSWYQFNILDVMIVLQHVLTPVFSIQLGIVNIINTINSGITTDISYITLFLITPVLISLLAIMNVFVKRRFSALLFAMIILFGIIEIIMAIKGMMPVRSRYAIVIMPVLLLVIADGLSNIRNKSLAGILVFILISVNFSYTGFDPLGTPKLGRDDQYKLIADMLEKFPLDKRDFLVMPFNGGKYLDRYYEKTQTFPLDVGEISTDKDQITPQVLNKQQIKMLSQTTAPIIFRNYIASPDIPPAFEKYIKKELIDKLQKGRYVAFIMMRPYLPYTKAELLDIAGNDAAYNSQIFGNMLRTKTTYNIFDVISSFLKPVAYESQGSMDIIIFQK